jgi:hypothetical protein
MKSLVSINSAGSMMSEYKGHVDSISSPTPIALYNVIIPKGNPNRQNYIFTYSYQPTKSLEEQ